MSLDEKPDRMTLDDMNTYLIQLVMGVLFVGAGLFGITLTGLNNLGGLLASAIFALIGAWIFISAKRDQVVLDRASGQMNVSKSSLLGGHTDSYPLTDIAKVRLNQRVEAMRQNIGSGMTIGSGMNYYNRPQTKYDIEFVMKDNSLKVFSNMINNQESAARVATFLNLQMEIVGAPTLQQTMEMAKGVVDEAIDRANADRNKPSDGL